MKSYRMGFWVFAVVGVMAGAAFAAGEPEKSDAKKPAAVCPISGDGIDKSVSVDYEGGKVYFCCEGCVPKFKADTAKYAAKANHQLVLTGQIKQVACPFTGGKVNPDKTQEVVGVKVGFCCGGCAAKLAKMEGKQQFETVFGKNFKKAFEIKKGPDKEKKQS